MVHAHAAPRPGFSWSALKFASTIALVIWVSLLPRQWAWVLLAPAALLLGILALGWIPRWPVVKRVLLLEPFVLGVALMAFFAPAGHDAPDWSARWSHFGFLMARCTLALLAMVLFSRSTPFSDMLRIFRVLRVPLLLVTTLALMHRYLFLLGEEVQRMRRARQCRDFTGRSRQWRALSTVISRLFLRSSERADRIYDAMCARGWGDGRAGGGSP